MTHLDLLVLPVLEGLKEFILDHQYKPDRIHITHDFFYQLMGADKEYAIVSLNIQQPDKPMLGRYPLEIHNAGGKDFWFEDNSEHPIEEDAEDE